LKACICCIATRNVGDLVPGIERLLTRTGLDWTAKYPVTAAALAKLPVEAAYMDGELCGVRPDGVTSFELTQQASDGGGGALERIERSRYGGGIGGGAGSGPDGVKFLLPERMGCRNPTLRQELFRWPR
jgi:hypothetical protein